MPSEKARQVVDSAGLRKHWLLPAPNDALDVDEIDGLLIVAWELPGEMRRQLQGDTKRRPLARANEAAFHARVPDAPSLAPNLSERPGQIARREAEADGGDPTADGAIDAHAGNEVVADAHAAEESALVHAASPTTTRDLAQHADDSSVARCWSATDPPPSDSGVGRRVFEPEPEQSRGLSAVRAGRVGVHDDAHRAGWDVQRAPPAPSPWTAGGTRHQHGSAWAATGGTWFCEPRAAASKAAIDARDVQRESYAMPPRAVDGVRYDAAPAAMAAFVRPRAEDLVAMRHAPEIGCGWPLAGVPTQPDRGAWGSPARDSCTFAAERIAPPHEPWLAPHVPACMPTTRGLPWPPTILEQHWQPRARPAVMHCAAAAHHAPMPPARRAPFAQPYGSPMYPAPPTEHAGYAVYGGGWYADGGAYVGGGACACARACAGRLHVSAHASGGRGGCGACLGGGRAFPSGCGAYPGAAACPNHPALVANGLAPSYLDRGTIVVEWDGSGAAQAREAIINPLVQIRPDMLAAGTPTITCHSRVASRPSTGAYMPSVFHGTSSDLAR